MRWICLLAILFVGCGNAAALDEPALIAQVAAEYKLAPDEAKLLRVIRRIENGRQGREFGVLTPAAMRYENGDATLSFLTQARWAAGTIKKRYNGDLEAFAARWCPIGAENDPTGLNKNWLRNARYYMENSK